MASFVLVSDHDFAITFDKDNGREWVLLFIKRWKRSSDALSLPHHSLGKPVCYLNGGRSGYARVNSECFCLCRCTDGFCYKRLPDCRRCAGVPQKDSRFALR